MMRYLAIALSVALLPLAGIAAESVLKNPETGDPKIQSASVISFGPGGTLLIGDSKGQQVVAIDTKDTTRKPWKAEPITELGAKIAARLGTKADNIEILHLAVNPASGTAYISVRNQSANTPAIVTVDGDGKISELALDKASYVAIPVKAKGVQISDVTYGKDRILVGALSKEEFGCKVYSIPTPLDSTKKAGGFSTETFHVAHNKWETGAPMTTVMQLERKGKQYVVGSFACTPLVRYPLEDIKPDAKVKGASVIELGNGNRPSNMFNYTKGDKSYLLINALANPRWNQGFKEPTFWVARVDLDLFDETENVNTKAPWRYDRKTREPSTDRVKMIDEYLGVKHMDKLNDKQALVIQGKGIDAQTLKALDLP